MTGDFVPRLSTTSPYLRPAAPEGNATFSGAEGLQDAPFCDSCHFYFD